MRNIFTLFLLIGVAVNAQTLRHIDNHLIVKLNESAYAQSGVDIATKTFGLTTLDALNAEIGLAEVSAIGQPAKTRTFLLEFAQAIDAETLAVRYERLGVLDYAVPNRIGSAAAQPSEVFPNDTRFNRQWALYNIGPGQAGVGPLTPVADADLDMELAWDVQTGDPEMVIAVIDGGARLTHPDLASRLWTNSAETANGVDDDGNGLIDDIYGWDYFFNDNDPTDERGHGTNVSGIIGAVANNGNLYAGANWNSKLMQLKCIDYDLNATYASVANSVYYAVDKGAKILNMSLGFAPASQVLEDFVVYAKEHNVLITAAMMNFNNNTTYYPAGYSLTHDNVIACGSSSPNDYRTVPFDWSPTSGSNFGNHINVVAPGIYIYSLAFYSDTVFTVSWSGTSMATPHVASVASLVWAEAPDLTPAQVRDLIQDTAQDQVGNPSEDTAGFDTYMGYGRANAHQAVLAAQQLTKADFGHREQVFKIINPVTQDQLEIFCNGSFTGVYDLTLHTMDGKLIHSQKKEITAGANAVPFPFASGSYMMALKSGAYTKVFKIVKQ